MDAVECKNKKGREGESKRDEDKLQFEMLPKTKLFHTAHD